MNSSGNRSASVDLVNAQDRLQDILRSLGQPPLAEDQAQQLIRYLRLLLRWNTKINLTAIRDEEGILRRNFIESILCARLLPYGISTLLDYGSGGGFPGIPCAICRPGVRVTLADSQAKKTAFLREVVRTLSLNAEVHDGRVEEMEAGLMFDAVTLRAVDRMQEACAGALLRVKLGGCLGVLATRKSLEASIGELSGLWWESPVQLPGTDQQVLLLGHRLPK
jgi:16S rRNA (guanine527-N7)-methyltransferase